MPMAAVLYYIFQSVSCRSYKDFDLNQCKMQFFLNFLLQVLDFPAFYHLLIGTRQCAVLLHLHLAFEEVFGSHKLPTCSDFLPG